MARIRSIHPSFFTDEAVVSCSPLARILYVGLWTDADDQGLFEWKPLQIKMRLLPGDNADAGALLDELADAGLIAELTAGGKRLGAIREFRAYQRPKKPNAVHVLPAEWRTFVGLGGASSEDTPSEEDTISEPVGNQFGTGSETPPQMEDGGEDEAVASFVDMAIAGVEVGRLQRQYYAQCLDWLQGAKAWDGTPETRPPPLHIDLGCDPFDTKARPSATGRVSWV